MVLVGAATGVGALAAFRRWSESKEVPVSTPQLQAGQPEEWQRFSNRVPGFVEEIPTSMRSRRPRSNAVCRRRRTTSSSKGSDS
jgi:hypothetical protein